MDDAQRTPISEPTDSPGDGDVTYWLARSRAAAAMARRALDARAKLAHYELSGRYAVAAWAAIATGGSMAGGRPSRDQAILSVVADPAPTVITVDAAAAPADARTSRSVDSLRTITLL